MVTGSSLWGSLSLVSLMSLSDDEDFSHVWTAESFKYQLRGSLTGLAPVCKQKHHFLCANC